MLPHGWRPFWHGAPSRSSPLLSPTRWRVLSGLFSPKAEHINLVWQSARRTPESSDNQDRLPGLDAGRGDVHQADDEPTGRNPEAREAVWYNAHKARFFDQPLASRTSSRPAVKGRINLHPPGNMAVMVNAPRQGLKTLEDAQEAAGG